GDNFFNKTYEDLNRYAVGEIAYRLENIDDLIFQNYKNDDKFKHYRVKDNIKRTLITLKGKITFNRRRYTFNRRRYYKINPITEKE
ncbi:hypothetical protein C6B38_05310, partial [Spiroplasma sp. ChiS]|uniref:hypothetical protein n=1 Tax=Spiroplasma sp. ChiS TaxID=2099885 RepID=UPI000D3F7350